MLWLCHHGKQKEAGEAVWPRVNTASGSVRCGTQTSWPAVLSPRPHRPQQCKRASQQSPLWDELFSMCPPSSAPAAVWERVHKAASHSLLPFYEDIASQERFTMHLFVLNFPCLYKWHGTNVMEKEYHELFLLPVYNCTAHNGSIAVAADLVYKGTLVC